MRIMQVVLVSGDQELRQLCGEILTELAGLSWQVATAASAHECPPAADLYIWDDGRVSPPAELDHARSRHLFVVHRDALTEHVGPAAAGAGPILLKPLTRSILSPFLHMASATAAEGAAAPNWLRAERDEILQCLIQCNLQIQRYDQNRTNFLARAVHDFRAPLMTVAGYCDLLLNEALGPANDEQKEVLRRMQHSIKRLTRVTSAMFELSLGKPCAAELRPGDIRQCAGQAVVEIAPMANQKSIGVTVEMDPQPGTLLLDQGEIERVFINLLENACKFTPKEGEIEIFGYPVTWDGAGAPAPPAAADEPGGHPRRLSAYRVDVRDSGPRIPAEHLPLLFEEYTSYGGGSDRSGAGLGLAICKMILRTHGGRLWVENLETGPQFSFVLPSRETSAELSPIERFQAPPSLSR